MGLVRPSLLGQDVDHLVAPRVTPWKHQIREGIGTVPQTTRSPRHPMQVNTLRVEGQAPVQRSRLRRRHGEGGVVRYKERYTLLRLLHHHLHPLHYLTWGHLRLS